MNDTRTPLKQVKGLGSAKEGTGHFWAQRLSAIALVPLILWLCFSIASLPGMDYVSLREWLSSPFPAVMMILLIVTAFFHARLGLQEVAIDYVGADGPRTIVFVLITFGAVILAVTGVFAVLRISLAGG